MSDRFSVPIRPRVRLISVASAVSISLLVCGNSWAQQKPAAGQQPPAAAKEQEVPVPPGTEGQLAGSRGNLVVKVQAYDEATGTLVPAANVVVRVESDFERPRYGITAIEAEDPTHGIARLRLPAGRYKVVVTSAQFQRDDKFVEVHEAPLAKNGGSFDLVNFVLYTRTEEIRERLVYSLLDRNEFSNLTRRDRRFFRDFPLGIGDRQSLSKQLRSIPGFVEDSINRVHPRGENAVTTATMLDGVLLPQIAAGRVAQYILPDSLQKVDARVGGLAAEYGGGSGTILDLQTRQAPPSGRYLDFAARGGEFDTTELYVNFGNSLTGPNRVLAKGPVRRFRYDVSLSQRYTNEAVNPPSDGFPNPNNYGVSNVAFAKATFDLSAYRSINAIVNFSSGQNGIATRQGFSASLKPFGSGFGFLGEKNFDGTQGLQPANSKGSLSSQEQLQQTFRQKDNNNLVLLQLKSKDRRGNEQMVAVGTTDSTLFVGNRPGTSLVKQGSLPRDRSIEYLPTVLNDYQQIFMQADYSTAAPRSDANRTHRFKFGAVFHTLNGLDSYQYQAQSTLALDELYAIDPRLAPPALPGAKQQIKPTGKVDERGNLEFKTLSDKVNYPVLSTNRTGSYAAAYIQDTYKVSSLFRMNLGLRFDSFEQTTDFITTNPDYTNKPAPVAKASVGTISPRVNVSYVSRYGPRLGGFLRPIDVVLKPLGLILNEQTIMRASFNRLVAPPELGQGYSQRNERGTQPNDSTLEKTFTSALVPQVTDQLDLSLERQIGDFSVLKFGIYSKNMKDTLTNRSNLGGLQAGMLSTINQGAGIADGYELGFETNPRLKNGNSVHAYFSFANSATKPKNAFQRTNLVGADQVGKNSATELVRSEYYEFDQTNTLSGGVAFNLVNGSSLGMSFLYGSGLYSSELALLPNVIPSIPNTPQNRNLPVRTGSRQTFSEVNLRVATRPDFLYRTRDGRGIGLEFSVENLFNSTARLNWRGSFAGTRYQLGRRFFLGVTGRL